MVENSAVITFPDHAWDAIVSRRGRLPYIDCRAFALLAEVIGTPRPHMTRTIRGQTLITSRRHIREADPFGKRYGHRRHLIKGLRITNTKLPGAIGPDAPELVFHEIEHLIFASGDVLHYR